jgi:hypothetical protein
LKAVQTFDKNDHGLKPGVILCDYAALEAPLFHGATRICGSYDEVKRWLSDES